MESVLGLVFIIALTGGVFEVVNAVLVDDILERAAHAVARDNALQDRAAATGQQLLERARNAVREEVGDQLDPDALTIAIDVYDNPSTMLSGVESTSANAGLGGDAGDMVVVRLSLTPRTPVRRFLPDGFTVQALAVARNERMIQQVP